MGQWYYTMQCHLGLLWDERTFLPERKVACNSMTRERTANSGWEGIKWKIIFLPRYSKKQTVVVDELNMYQ